MTLDLTNWEPALPAPGATLALTFVIDEPILEDLVGQLTLLRRDTATILTEISVGKIPLGRATVRLRFTVWEAPELPLKADLKLITPERFLGGLSFDITTTVLPPPPPPPELTAVVRIQPSEGVAPLTSTLTADPSGGEPPYSISWVFGDERAGLSSPISHTWSAPGTYRVQVLVLDKAGTRFELGQDVIVRSEPLPPPPVITTIPVLGEAISAALTYLGQLLKAFADFTAPAVEALPALGEKLIVLQGALDGLKLSLAPLATLQGEGLNTFLRNLLPGQADMGTSYATALRVGSPEWQGEVRSTLQGAWFSPVALLRRDLLDRAPATPYIDPGAALALAIEARDRIELVSFGIGVATVLGEIATLGQVEAGTQLADRLLTLSGVSQFAQGVNSTIFDVLLAPGLRYGLNAQFQPNIPSFPDLINMVVKEVIPLETFRELAPLQGYSSEWADRIWLAHFFPPTRGELHLMLHRGLLTEAAVTKLETLVDLDPRFREINRETGALGTGDLDIWAELRYRDPSITEARFMFEQAAIDRLGVQAIVQRSGMAPPFVEPLTNFLTTFQDRIWRRQFLLAARAGYRVGALTEEELLAAVAEARFPPSVAEWIVKGEGMRRKVRDFMRAKPEAGRELTPAEVVRAVVKKLRDATWGKTRLVDAGFDEEDAELKLALALEQPGEAA